MYAMAGKLFAPPAKRDELIAILLQAAQIVGRLPGCRMYAVGADQADESCAWVMEIWDDQQAHDRSLADERVRSLIARARPLLAGAPQGAEIRLVGGHGIPLPGAS